MRSPWIPVVLNTLMFVLLEWMVWMPLLVFAFDEPDYHSPERFHSVCRFMVGNWGIHFIALGLLLSLLGLIGVGMGHRRHAIPNWMGVAGMWTGVLNLSAWSGFVWIFVLHRAEYSQLLRGP